MARTIDHLNRVSESFDMLCDDEKKSIVAELYTRLTNQQAEHTMRLISFWSRIEDRKNMVPRRNVEPDDDSAESQELPFDKDGAE